MQHALGVAQQPRLTTCDVLADLILELRQVDQRLAQCRRRTFAMVQPDRRWFGEHRRRVSALTVVATHVAKQRVFKIVFDQQQGRREFHPARITGVQRQRVEQVGLTVDDPLQRTEIQHGQRVRHPLERARHRFMLFGRALTGADREINFILDLGEVLADLVGDPGEHFGVRAANADAHLLELRIRHQAVIQPQSGD